MSANLLKALFKLIENNDPKHVKQLIEQNKEAIKKIINASDKNGVTPLHWAVAHKNTEMAQLLIDNGAEIDKPNNDGDAPLHWAVLKDDVKMVKLLIKNGAKINTLNNNKDAPLDLAESLKNEKLIMVLLEENMKDPENAQAVLDKVDEKSGDTLLHWAVHNKYEKITRLLIKHGIDVKKPNKDGDLAIDIAKEIKHKVLTKMLEVASLKESKQWTKINEHRTKLTVTLPKQLASLAVTFNFKTNKVIKEETDLVNGNTAIYHSEEFDLEAKTPEKVQGTEGSYCDDFNKAGCLFIKDAIIELKAKLKKLATPK